jgi:hypothetical protein
VGLPETGFLSRLNLQFSNGLELWLAGRSVQYVDFVAPVWKYYFLSS